MKTHTILNIISVQKRRQIFLVFHKSKVVNNNITRQYVYIFLSHMRLDHVQENCRKTSDVINGWPLRL